MVKAVKVVFGGVIYPLCNSIPQCILCVEKIFRLDEFAFNTEYTKNGDFHREKGKNQN